jgi:hypothetical protein
LYYTIYQTTNKINGNIYIGKHQTENLDDGYLGSGKVLTRAIEKHGIENFSKEILFIFDTEEEMNAKEKELVNEEFLARSDVYNLCLGGQGGFSYINNNGFDKKPELASAAHKKRLDEDTEYRERYLAKMKIILSSPEQKKKVSEGLLSYYESGEARSGFLGKEHSEETKKKIGAANAVAQKGEGNSQYGSMWITNGTISKKIKKGIDLIPEGWYKGRVIK